MASVIAADVAGELELDRENAPVFSFDDEVDFVLPSTRPQMKDLGLRRLGAYAQRQCVSIEPEEPCRERRIGELVLRRVRETPDAIPSRRPRRPESTTQSRSSTSR